MTNQTCYKVAVNSKILADILYSFREASVQWDGTLNHIDRFCPVNHVIPLKWQKLCQNCGSNPILINYVE